VVAHGSFELAEYPRAEHGYTQVLAVTPEGDQSRAALVDNLAASIYNRVNSQTRRRTIARPPTTSLGFAPRAYIIYP